MDNKEKSSMGSFMSTWSSISDNIVSKFYSEGFVKNIESLGFMQSLIKSSFIEALQNFWKGWFKQVFVFFWYLAIIFWLINLFFQAFSLLNNLGYMRWMTLVVWSIITSILMVLTWFWIVKFKKWYPFMIIITYIIQLVILIASPMAYGYWAAGSFYYSWASIWSMILSFWFFIVWLALVFKNKALFNN